MRGHGAISVKLENHFILQPLRNTPKVLYWQLFGSCRERSFEDRNACVLV